MRYKLIITEDAENDIEIANDYYELKQKGLGTKFVFSIRNCLKLIAKNPYAFAKIYLEIRKVNTKKFPYSLYYTIEPENEITLFAVIHHSRNEEKWKNRIEDFE